MISRREPDEITDWMLAFHTWTPSWWIRLIIPGTFKHVTCYAWAPKALTWVFLDFSLIGAHVILLPYGDAAMAEIMRLTEGADVLRVKSAPMKSGFRFLIFGCVGAIKHLLGIRCGAVRPDALWRFLVENGAEVIIDGHSQAKRANGHDPADRPGAGGRADATA